MASRDGTLRALRRACAADPRDAGLWTRYARELERARARGGREDLREAYALALVRTGRQAEAARLLGIRWEAEPEPHGGQLGWKQQVLDAAAVRALVDEDLRLLDPLRLLESFPRTRAGELRLNTTRILRRYRAHDPGQPHRRLALLAWTPGTATLWDRPEDQGQRQVTIALETRSHVSKVLPAAAWRDD